MAKASFTTCPASGKINKRAFKKSLVELGQCFMPNKREDAQFIEVGHPNLD